ncbi:MAG: hypothetical protein ABI443_00460 [Chthoniobacterales bacterium]
MVRLLEQNENAAQVIPAAQDPRGVDFSLGPGNIFNAMTHPFIGYAIRGFLWY